MIFNVISKSKGFRDNVDTEFKHQFSLTVKLGEEVSTVSSVPRLAKRQSRFRPNLENDDLLSYYIGTLTIPFFDDINSQVEYGLKDRNHKNIFAILPSVMFERDYNLNLLWRFCQLNIITKW